MEDEMNPMPVADIMEDIRVDGQTMAEDDSEEDDVDWEEVEDIVEVDVDGWAEDDSEDEADRLPDAVADDRRPTFDGFSWYQNLPSAQRCGFDCVKDHYFSLKFLTFYILDMGYIKGAGLQNRCPLCRMPGTEVSFHGHNMSFDAFVIHAKAMRNVWPRVASLAASTPGYNRFLTLKWSMRTTHTLPAHVCICCLADISRSKYVYYFDGCVRRHLYCVRCAVYLGECPFNCGGPHPPAVRATIVVVGSRAFSVSERHIDEVRQMSDAGDLVTLDEHHELSHLERTCLSSHTISQLLW